MVGFHFPPTRPLTFIILCSNWSVCFTILCSNLSVCFIILCYKEKNCSIILNIIYLSFTSRRIYNIKSKLTESVLFIDYNFIYLKKCYFIYEIFLFIFSNTYIQLSIILLVYQFRIIFSNVF